MANEFVDCLVVLEKHDVCDKELAVSSLVFKCIKEHKQDYVSHFTSVFNVNGLYYYVSVVRIRNVGLVEKFIGEKGRSDNMNTAVFDSIVSDINQKADRLGQEGGMIMYAVLSRPSTGEMTSGCFYVWDGKVICGIRDVGPTIVRFGLKSFKSSSHEVLDDNTIVHLEAAYIGAERIEQNPSNYVVLPGMLLNDFLRLTITLDPGPFDDSNEFFLELLHITLIERTMFQLIEQGFPIRLCNPAIRQTPLVRYNGPLTDISSQSQNYGSKSHGISLVNIPSYMYRCRFPKVGVTLFSNNLARHHFLEIKVVLQYKGLHVCMTVYHLINVASKISPKKISFSMPSISRGYHVFEKHSLTHFKGLLMISKVLARFSSKDEKHLVHSIEALSTGSSILANAIIQLPSSEEERLGFTKALLSRGRAAISDLNWAFSSEAVLLCEVLPQAEFESHQILNPHYLYGGIFVHLKSRRYHCPILFQNLVPSLGDSVTSANGVVHELVVRFKPPGQFKVIDAARIVLPSMLISSFIDAELIVLDGKGNAPSNVSIERIEVFFEGLIRNGKALGERFPKILSEHSVEVPCAREVGNFRIVSGGVLLYNFSGSLSDFKIPDVGPSVLSKKLGRSYRLGFLVSIYHMDTKKSLSLSVLSQIAVAAKPTRLLADKSTPPKYSR